MNCLECPYGECINNSPATEQERKSAAERDKKCKAITGVDLTKKYVHNRPDKEEYTKERNRSYDRKREGSPQRKEHKRNQYLRHREAKLAYQHSYYQQHREEILARSKAHYEAHKEEINAKRREARKQRRMSASA